MALYLKGKKLSDSKVISVGGKYNIEVIDKFDEYGNKYQTLNITDWDYLPYDRVFGNNTPARISAVSAEIAKKKYTSEQVAEIFGWNLGDTITIPLSNGENIEMRIIGFNHDTLSKDHRSKAGITLEMTHSLLTLYRMNPSGSNAGGYPASEFKTLTAPTIIALLPQEWQDIIQFVDKKSMNGGGSNYTEIVTSSENIFLLADSEIVSYADYNEGTLYEYWKSRQKSSDRSKGVGKNGYKQYWWLRGCPTTTAGYTNHWNYVTNTGGMGNGFQSNQYGISFAFCV